MQAVSGQPLAGIANPDRKSGERGAQGLGSGGKRRGLPDLVKKDLESLLGNHGAIDGLLVIPAQALERQVAPLVEGKGLAGGRKFLLPEKGLGPKLETALDAAILGRRPATLFLNGFLKGQDFLLLHRPLRSFG